MACASAAAHRMSSVPESPDIAGRGAGAARPSLRRRLALVTVVVDDYDRAIAWFTDVLGFALVEDRYVPEQDKRWVVVAPGTGGANVLLARAVNEEQRAAVGRQTGGRVGFFLETSDFAADYRDLTARGVCFVRPPMVAPYGTVAVFEDPWGNSWDLLELARS